MGGRSVEDKEGYKNSNRKSFKNVRLQRLKSRESQVQKSE
jgi:hypothetical protein